MIPFILWAARDLGISLREPAGRLEISPYGVEFPLKRGRSPFTFMRGTRL